MYYSTSINVYGSVKLNTVLLDPIINYNQLGSETRKPSNCSRRIGIRRSQHENSYAGSSNLVKLSCKGGKPKMVDAFSTSPAHTHNNTKDEKGHPRKSDKRNKPVEGRNMRTAQVNAGRTLSFQLRARSAKNEAWRLKDLHTGRMETAQTTCTADRETDNAKREIRREEDPVRRNCLPQSNRNNPGKSLNSSSCKNPSIHMTNRQDKSRRWNGKIAQKLKKNNHQPNRTNPGKLSNFF